MELLGFQTERTEKNIRAKHQKYGTMVFEELNKGGVSFVYSFKTNETAKRHKTEFLEWINQLNLQSFILRFCTDAEFDRIIIDAWYPSLYDKSSFEQFLALFLGGISIPHVDENTAKEAKKFLV